jgi:putative transposase
MNSTPRFDRNSLDENQCDIANWPGVNLNQLKRKNRKRVQRYQEAIGRYLAGHKVKDICKIKGVCNSELIRVMKRCLEVHEDGRIWGFRALLFHVRQHGYQRVKPVEPAVGDGRSGRAGALTQLFEKFPQLAELAKGLLIKDLKDQTVHESRIPLKSIHKRVVTSCRSLGLTARDYPLNQKYLGRAALHSHLKSLMNTRAAVAARCGERAAKNLGTGEEIAEEPRKLRPFQVGEFDGHRIDMSCIVLVPSPYGGFEKRAIERFWILTVLDPCTRVVLGYAISLKREYSQDDVLRCFKNAVTPWQPEPLTIPGLSYPAGGCFPSDVYPELQWAVFDEIKWDNAKAHLAKKTIDRLCTILGCEPSAGPGATPNDRPFIERWFQTFEANGFWRLPSTTGSHPKDPRRKDPEEAALKYEIYLNDIEELAAVIIADYNWDPHSGIGFRPPLEHLGILLEDEEMKDMIRKLPASRRNNLRLLDMEVSRQVRGSMKDGRRPYVEFESVRYTSSILARSPELIGKRLRLSVDPESASKVCAYLPSGAELGVLTARGVWGRTPHTLEARKAIFVLRHRKLIRYTERDDPIQIYMDHLAREALKNKAAAREYARIQRAARRAVTPTKLPKPSPVPKIDQPEPDDSTPATVTVHKGFNF